MSKFLWKRLKRLLKNGEAEPIKRDFPLIKERLTNISLGGTYKEACHEWQFIRLIEEDDVARFTDHCELCNQGGLKLNFEIYNSDTDKHLMVGSTCINRFIILKGTSSAAESWDYFVSAAHKLAGYKNLHLLLPEVLKEHPEPRDIMLFRKISKEILGDLNSNNISKKIWFDYVHNLLGPKSGNIEDFGRKIKLNRIRDILFNPRNVPVRKPKKYDTGQVMGNWAGKGRRRARVITSLAMSEVYKNPQRKPFKD